MQRNQLTTFAWTVAFVALAAPQLQAQVGIYWQGGDGVLTAANYTDLVTPNLAPTASDTVYFGGSDATGVTGTLTGPVDPVSFSRLIVGYNDEDAAAAPDVTPLDGEGIVNVNGGAQINLTGGAAGAANAGLIVGNVRIGELNIDGVGSSVTSNRLIVIGFATNQLNRSGTVNVTNGGALISLAGNIDLGTGGTAANNGIQGHLFISGEGSLVQALGDGADLNIGIRRGTSSVTQTGGSIAIADVIEVGFDGNGTIQNPNSSFTISGGTTTNGGNFFVGRGASTGATFTMSGGEVTVGTPDNPDTPDVNEAKGRFLMGGSTATGIVANHSGGTLSTVLDVRVGDAGTSEATYNLSGTGVINSATGGHVGRQGVGKFFQTGGIANFNGGFQIGNREVATGANDGLYEISAGDLNFGASLNIATNGIGRFNVVGDDATIDVAGDLNVNTSANGNGTLAFKLESGDALSTINVVGTAAFATGTSLILDDSAFPATQTSYDLLTAGFILDSGLTFTGPASWTYEIVSGGLGQILRVNGPASVADDADFDQDGDVDGADFLTWQRGVGTNSGGTLAQGDANNDGAINNADLDVFKQQFGTSVVAAGAVPEPAAGVLLLTSIATAAAWRRRRRA